MRPFSTPLFLLASLLCARGVLAQEPLRGLFSPNDFVRSAAIAGDTFYVGSDFTAVGPPTGQAAVLDPATGLPDLSQARVSGEVRVILPDGAGGWYVGGEIDFAGGQPRRNLAHVLANGSLDADFTPTPQVTGSPFNFGVVSALALSPDGQTLYVGGLFDAVGGQPRANLAAINARTGTVLSFLANTTGELKSVRSLLCVPYGDGSGAALYVGGAFSEIGGVPRPGIAAVDSETGAVLAWNPEPETDDSFLITGKLELGTPPGPGQPGTLYMRASYNRLRGQPCVSSPAEVTLADPQTGEGGAPTGFCIASNGFNDMAVVGDAIFIVDDFSNRGVIKRIDRATGAITPFFGGAPYGMSNGGGPRAIAYDPTGGSGGGVLYVNTGRDDNRPVGRGSVVIGVDALTRQRVGPEMPIANARTGLGVIELAVEPGGRLFAGGADFASVGVGGEDRRFLAGLDLTTGAAISFGTDFVIFSSVENVAVSPDEQTLYFATFNGIGVADLTTGEIMTFPTGGALADPPSTEATGDTTIGHVRRGVRGGPVGTRADGRPLAPFATPIRSRGADDAARRGGHSRVRTNGSTLVVTDDRLYVHPGGGVDAFDRDTATLIWSVSVPAFLTDPNYFDVVLVEGGPPGAAGDTLFLAGSILSAGGQPRDRFAALDAETGAVLDWNLNPTKPSNGSGTAIAVLGSPVFVAGNGLDTIGGEPRRDIAAADVTTGDVLGWISGDPDAGGPALAVQPGPAGGVAGGVVYSRGRALDAETGARIGDWALEPVGSVNSGFGGGAFSTLVSERHERIILTGTFVNSLRGSGHAFVTALTPARPFAVAGEPGATEAPRTASLALAGPNPLRTRTVIAVTLPEAQAVEAALFDVLGRRVAVLHDGALPAGVSRIDVDASDLPAGVYVVRVSGTGFTDARTLTVVR